MWGLLAGRAAARRRRVYPADGAHGAADVAERPLPVPADDGLGEAGGELVNGAGRADGGRGSRPAAACLGAGSRVGAADALGDRQAGGAGLGDWAARVESTMAGSSAMAGSVPLPSSMASMSHMKLMKSLTAGSAERKPRLRPRAWPAPGRRRRGAPLRWSARR